MAGILPLFNSAPRIKIRLDGKTLAYAIGFNIGISIDVQPVNIIGTFQPVSLEPTMYNIVTGTMQIIRLISQQQREDIKNLAKTNENKQVVDSPSYVVDYEQDTANSPIKRGGLYQHLDPRQVLSSRSFNIDLYIRVPVAGAVFNGETDEVLWMSVRDCRITSRNTNISMGSLTNEPLTFQGIYASPTSTTGNLLFASDDLIKEKQSL
jgi:hypothetical protein